MHIKFFKGAMIYAMVIGGVGRFVLSLWSRADHPSESEGCNSGTSDPGSDDFFCPVFLGYSEDIFRHTEI